MSRDGSKNIMQEQEQKMSNGVNKTIITVIIAAVLVGVYFFFRGASEPTPSVQQTLSQETVSQQPFSEPSNQEPLPEQALKQTPVANENVVIYTNAGYSPTTLRIKKGDTITFKNQSSQSMWTASDIHPTHREYPTTSGCLGSTFDACKGVQPNESWSFKFDIAGAWKYHNHLSPGDIGTIIVE